MFFRPHGTHPIGYMEPGASRNESTSLVAMALHLGSKNGKSNRFQPFEDVSPSPPPFNAISGGGYTFFFCKFEILTPFSSRK